MKIDINTLEYMDYIGSINFSLEDNCLFGKVLGIDASISYEGATLNELKEDFINGIDDYLQYCKQKNIEPQKPFAGVFNVRLTPENHRLATLTAQNKRISLNKFVTQAVEHELARY